MNRTITFPESLTDFLYWIKETTEAYWSKLPAEKKMYGAKWLPLTEEQIDTLESKYSLKFYIEHRAFLKILHTINKQKEFDEDHQNIEGPSYPPSLFYNWITETDWIENRLAFIEDFFTYLIKEPKNRWLQSWGPCPDSEEERVQIFKEWYRNAPDLIPLRAHTYLMADGGTGLKPVLSVYGFDTIVMAWSLRHFLIREYAEELGLTAIYYDEDSEVYTDLIKGVPEIDMLQTIKLDEAEIPYWKEVITYYTSSWQGLW